MKFTVEKKEISEALSLVASVAEKRQSIPVLSNILLKAEKDGLTLIATDLEIELTFKIPKIELINEGETTVSARKLADLIRSVPEDTVLTFELIENQLEISALKFQADFSTLPVGDFPVTEIQEFEREVALPGKELSDLIEKTSFAMASQDVRYYLNGILLEVSPSQINVVATDGHRLAWSSCKIKTDFTDEKIIIPRKSALELQKLLNLYPENVNIAFNSNQLKVFSDEYTFISKLIEGSYPDYEKVFPKGTEQKLKANKSLVQTALNSLKMMMENQSATAHNLANVNTPGFRQDVATDFSSIYLNRQNGVEPRIVSSRNTGGFSLEQGQMENTQNPKDVAIQNDGYFIIQPKNNGDIAFSRRGDFQLNEENELIDGANNKILDDGLQPIVLRPFKSISISPNGQIFISPIGAAPDAEEIEIGMIGTTVPEENQKLKKSLDGHIRYEPDVNVKLFVAELYATVTPPPTIPDEFST